MTEIQRFTAQHPCPICKGHDRMQRGKSERCSGFKSGDNVLCTREEYAGKLEPQNTTPPAYKHSLHGPCKCGVTHNRDTNTPTQRQSRRTGTRPQLSATYSYKQENGRLAYEALRYEPKDFRQRRPDPTTQNGWAWNMDSVSYVPYNLPALCKANPDELIFIPEGEKDADNLIAIGLLATTFIGGAMADKEGKPARSKWKPEYNKYFKGRRLVLLPDNDAPGAGHVKVISDALRNVAQSITILPLPNLPDKGDVSDWLAAGGTRAKLEALANTPQELPARKTLLEALADEDQEALLECSEEYASLEDVVRSRIKFEIKQKFPHFPMREFDEVIRHVQEDLAKKNRRKPNIISARTLMSKQFVAKKWTVPNILPTGLIALAGKQKIGKSWLDYNLSLSVAGGGVALGSIQVEQGDVLYMALEDNEQRLQDRLKQLLAPGQDVPDKLDVVTEWPYRMDIDGLALLEEWIQSKDNPRLIIIDPWVKAKPRVKTRQGETGYDADYDALEGLKKLSDKYDLTILVQFHLRKAGAEDPFDELNATTGVTACADGFLSLKRTRGESDATLWGTGRDYKEDVDLALSFNNGNWKVLGNAVTYQLSKASKEVIDVLNSAGRPLQPTEIAFALDIPAGTIRKRLMDMKQREEVKDTGNGYIAIIGNAGNGGNGGNAGNGGNGVTPQAQSVTESAERYVSNNNGVTPINPLVKPSEQGSVTSVTPVTTNNDDREEFII